MNRPFQTHLFQETLEVIDAIEASASPDEFDERIRQKSPQGFIGVDEAGRGPLAGPVFAAAVILPQGHGIKGLRDSKKIGRAEREDLAGQIALKSVAHAVALADVDEIEEKNILNAALLAMRRAVEKLESSLPVIIDGNQTLPGISNIQRALVKGDNRSASVAAASILAKVDRDRYMLEMDLKYPQYGFKAHKGYGTALHMEKIRAHGPCEIHRKTFKGVLV